jgi:hypothetical protein
MGCGDGSDGKTLEENALSYSGVWNLEYDVLVDECGLVEKGQNAFTDMQTVVQNGESIILTSNNLSENQYIGEVRSDGSLEAGTSQDGDLFGDGIDCQLEEALTYNNHSGSTVSSLYDLRLKCNDGFYCVTALRGVGQKSEE